VESAGSSLLISLHQPYPLPVALSLPPLQPVTGQASDRQQLGERLRPDEQMSRRRRSGDDGWETGDGREAAARRAAMAAGEQRRRLSEGEQEAARRGEIGGGREQF
jgi:hypothetical protein